METTMMDTAAAFDETLNEMDAYLKETDPENEAGTNVKLVKDLEAKIQQRNLWKRQLDDCFCFFNQVAALLTDIYEILPGKNRGKSFCLIPKGTAGQVNYYEKPVNSLRVGMNWNWRANLEKCSNPRHIQCVTPDLPYVKPRPKDHPERASQPIFGNMVALFDTDRKYHCLHGEKYIRETREWIWRDDLTAEAVADMLRERYMATAAKAAEKA